MARAKNNPQSIFGSGNVSTTSQPPSRLTESTAQLRGALLSRNIYSDFNQYPLPENTRQRVVSSVSSILDVVSPFTSSSFSDSVLGRLASTPKTPLSDIGLILLGKQFLLNFKSNVQQELIPSINLKNVFDGNPDSKLFQKKIKYNITRKQEGGNLTNFLEDYFGSYSVNSSTFSKNPTNEEYLINTGEAQLDFLFGKTSPSIASGGINKNIYKPSGSAYVNAAAESDNKIGKRSDIMPQRTWFNYLYRGNSPYISIVPTLDLVNSIVSSDQSMASSYIAMGEITQEYAPDLDFIRNNFGVSDKKSNSKSISELTSKDDPDAFDRLVYDNGGLNEDINQQLVWGRDGVSDRAEGRLSVLRGLDENINVTRKNPQTDFNIRGGLLEYTRNLLNASEGSLIDQTRKIYVNGDRVAGMNGSALWKSPDGRTGVRQHSILDQYDRFAKAIRFNGNIDYEGNPNSVIYDSVIPRMHPTYNERIGVLNNRNLTFSIENLAVLVIGDNNVTMIDDEYGTQIPITEAGPFGGRMMWFPPYGIELNEVSSAKYDTVAMVGRGEPMYSYMYSERSANLSFKLIMDHPEQVAQFYGRENHSEVAKFYAFGGNEFTPTTEIIDNSKLIKEKQDEILRIRNSQQQSIPDVIIPDEFRISFPNGYPQSGSMSVIDELFTNKYRYELNADWKSADGTSFALNSRVFDLTYISRIGDEDFYIDAPDGYTQSGAEYISGKRDLDDEIYRVFNDNNNVKFFRIEVIGRATLLGNTEINQTLSQNRADATKAFIEKRIEKVLGQRADTLGIEITATGIGTEGGSQDFSKPDTIHQRGAKEERISTIQFKEKDTVPQNVETQLSASDLQTISQLENEISVLESEMNTTKRNSPKSGVYKERKADENSTNDSAILKGFKSVSGNYFYPMFNSQTPEDFHRRLTFLQQCVRQGSAVRSATDVDDNGIVRAKNSVFGKQPICVLRIGDFFYTKVVIENITIDYEDFPWDLNPEGWGMQPMIASVNLQMKVIGGQSLKGPIDALQNAVSFNYYANSTYKNKGGVYNTAIKNETLQHGADREPVGLTKLNPIEINSII
jgi:hypothetical protein